MKSKSHTSVMTLCKKLTVILVLYLLTSRGKCNNPTMTTNSFSVRNEGNPLSPHIIQRKETTRYTELPNGFRMSTISEEDDNFHESSGTVDGFGPFTFRGDYSPPPPPPPPSTPPTPPYSGPPTPPYSGPPTPPYSGPPTPPYSGPPMSQPYGGPYGYSAVQPNGINNFPPIVPPYQGGGYSNAPVIPPYTAPPNYYTMPPPNVPQMGYRPGGKQANSQFDSEYLKGIFKGYEMARRIKSSPTRGANKPNRSDIVTNDVLLQDLLENLY